MAQVMILDDDGIEEKDELAVNGSGEVEFRFSKDAAANVRVDWSGHTVVLKPSARANIGVIPNGDITLSGGVDWGILERSIGTNAAIGFKFPNNTSFNINHIYNSDGHQIGFSLKFIL